MEGSADGKVDGFLGAVIVRKFDGAIDGAGVSGDYNLLGRVDIRRLANLSLCRIGYNFADLAGR